MPLPKAPTKPATLLDMATVVKAKARPARGAEPEADVALAQPIAAAREAPPEAASTAPAARPPGRSRRTSTEPVAAAPGTPLASKDVVSRRPRAGTRSADAPAATMNIGWRMT